MKLPDARAEGERVVKQLLLKFRQDTGNARWIGRMALSPLERRFTPSPDTGVTDTEPRVDAPQDARTTASTPPVSIRSWNILSAAELVEYLATCDAEDARAILAEERSHLGRAAVIDAASRRLA
ncbi:MAG: hypothetical protein ACKOFZ_06995 [Ilumatobacteraceae bacterium]|jgi:hypothetical protein